MCPWVGSHANSFPRQLWGLPCRMRYLSPQVYSMITSPLWLEFRGLSGWQVTASWTVYRLACHQLLPFLRVTFAMVPNVAWPGPDRLSWATVPAAGPVGWQGRPSAPNSWGVVCCFPSLVRHTCARVCSVHGCLVPCHCCACMVCSGYSVCGVLGLLAPVHRCDRSARCVVCAVSWATWLLFTAVPVRCVVLRVRCPERLGNCSLVRRLGVLCCVCSVLGHLVPVQRCARSVSSLVFAVFWATWLLFTGVPAPRVVLRVRCPGPLGSCSLLYPFGVLCCVCSVLCDLGPVHWCARWVCCAVCAVSWATWFLFTGVPARCVLLHVR